MTPGDLVEPLKQTANFRLKLNAAANCEGREIPVLPNPAIPVTPPARPSRRNVDPQTKRKLGTDTALVGIKPLVEETETTSEATSPLVERPIMVFPGKRPHVLLLQPGRGGEKHSPQELDLEARWHWAERQRAGL